MTPVRVIGRKIASTTHYQMFDINTVKYMTELTNAAQKSPGYIKSKNYYECNGDNIGHEIKRTLYNISDWRSLHDWQLWLNSDERECIKSKFAKTIINEKFNMLYVKGTEEPFLL